MKMKSTRIIFLPIFLGIFALFLLFPSVGLAVDFSITDVKIDAYLKEDGLVEVEETHTYSFDGEFNGITREIIPKEGSSIGKLEATENGKKLKVERDEHLYKIYRKGEDETITVKLSYTIKNGVDVYSDVAEFYWPFFDDRNESTYENMIITIHPPKETQDVIAFGYDEAFETEEIKADGTVIFQMGEVPYEENGDIRVAYDVILFPDANISADKPMKDQILQAKQSIYDEIQAAAESKEKYSLIALIIIPFFSLIILILIVVTRTRARMKKLDVERKAPQSFFVPEETLSLPGSIYFTKGFLPPEATAAALLDLVRKGYVSKVGETQFRLVKTPADMLEHERMLLSLLFNEIGSGEEFSFDDVKAYTNKKKNHEKYQSKILKWQHAVINEVKQLGLRETNKGLRWTLILIGLVLLPLSFLFLIYELFAWFFATLVLGVTYFIFGVAYKPKSLHGVMLTHEWELMKDRIQEVSSKEWETLTKDDQMRAFIYGVGTKDKKLMKKNEELLQSLQPPEPNRFNHSQTVYDSPLYSIGPAASTCFHSAHKTTQSTTSGSSSSSSGGGTGGGGGGSGAF
ncbi:DUF2207 domain-containing protein [Bacillus sp. 31A1R]|uniref:DUF2207 domain-containing protein n=1 Tax=Robertmurraya mangrovi TaxID=3098077 RepID=A0ABU5J0G4_9BACI|nr:DUF2207 domain-containing protein [Bacillus sp. 31A1R]MDZ5472908.1 DUF2207 domain-containing protein [Bacillus sp. 31A1R]